ncbi:MAG: cyclic nucleotide-binding domain-containing protein [Rhodospirillaceae bacterium]
MERKFSRRTFQPGDVIFAQGDRAGEAFLLQSGRVRLEHRDEVGVLEIDTIGPGQIFGELGVISDMNRMATATAMDEVAILCCHRHELHAHLDALEKEDYDAIRFLIAYCQDYLPLDMTGPRPYDEITQERDKMARELLRHYTRPGVFRGMEVFMASFFKAIIGYVKRRVPKA